MSSCDDILGEDRSLVNNTAQLEAIGYGTLVFSLIWFPLCWLSFVWFRSSFEHLRKRSLFMLTIFNFVSMFFCVLLSIVLIIGDENFDCHIWAFGAGLSFVLILLSHFLRIFSYVWRVRFNQGIINCRFKRLQDTGFLLNGSPSSSLVETVRGSSFMTSFEGLPSKPKKPWLECVSLKKFFMTLLCWKPNNNIPSKLQFTLFLSSARVSFALLVALFMLLAAMITTETRALLPFNMTCTGCVVKSGENFIVTMITTMIIGAFVLFKLRNYPDSLGLKQEIYVFVGLAVIFHTLAIELPFSIDAIGDIESERRFDTNVFVILELWVVVFHALPYQVYKAIKESRSIILGESIEIFVQSEEGFKAYLLYLSTKLSAENLMFFKAAKKFEEDFDTNTAKENMDFAEGIYSVYYTEESYLGINISWKERKRIRDLLNQGQITKDTFCRAARVCLDHIDGAVFQDFLDSSYYEAYKNSLLIPDGEEGDFRATLEGGYFN